MVSIQLRTKSSHLHWGIFKRLIIKPSIYSIYITLNTLAS
nr:MAG TPA: hypothetical protein [Caudoviricetes sp.]